MLRMKRIVDLKSKMVLIEALFLILIFLTPMPSCLLIDLLTYWLNKEVKGAAQANIKRLAKNNKGFALS